jgi:hypothetical protein
MDIKQYAYYTGVGVVVATHVYMVASVMPETMQKNHAYINLLAAGLIIYAHM